MLKPLPSDCDPVLLYLADDQATSYLAEICAQHLGGGATILLSGPVGAGKSHFARAFIRAILGAKVDVPSPSFTLVQCYAADGFDIWHADLYRLTQASDVVELGLSEAMGRDLCLIEWPDRLGDAPRAALRLDLSYEGEARRAQITGLSAPLRAALTAAFAQ